MPLRGINRRENLCARQDAVLCCAVLTALLADAQDHSQDEMEILHLIMRPLAHLRFFLTTACMMLVWPVCQTGPSSSHHLLARLINSTFDRFASGLWKGEQKPKEGVMFWSPTCTAHTEYICNDAPRKTRSALRESSLQCSVITEEMSRKIRKFDGLIVDIP